MDNNASDDKEKVDATKQSVSPAAPQSVSPTPQPSTDVEAKTVKDEDEGVQTGGLRFVPNVDGTRYYPDQKPVETTGDPTPTPEEHPSGDKPAEAEKTSEPVGR